VTSVVAQRDAFAAIDPAVDQALQDAVCGALGSFRPRPWNLLLAVTAGQRYAQSKEQDIAARNEARAHWKAIQQIDADHPHALYLRVITPQSSNIYLPLGY
jgi:hypothetical protein